MGWWRGLTAKLIAGILGGSLAVYLGILLHVERRVHTLLIERARDDAQRIRQGVADRLDASLRPAEEVPERLARILATITPDRAALDDVLRTVLANNSALQGVAVVPGSRAVQGVRWSRRGDEVVRQDLPVDRRDGPLGWFRRALDEGRPIWSGPDRDPLTGESLLTRAAPISSARGVVAADVSLAWLQEHVGSIRVARTGFAFVVTKTGLVLAHPDPGLVLSATLPDLARPIGNPALTEAAGRMTRGETGFVRAVSPRTGEPAWFFYGPLVVVDGAVAVVLPESEIAEDAVRLGRRMALLGAVGSAGLALIVVLLSVSITRPLRRLVRATQEVARGRLQADLPQARSRDEVGRLTADFKRMQESLVRYVEEQRRAAAAEERLQSQLRIARDIQMGMLPQDLPVLAHGTGYEVSAVLEPALRVGGDLYDVVRLDDDRMVIVVGDVSGKGIPASLFMAMSGTLIRTAARHGDPPAEILRRVNDELAASNPGNMFVTVLCLLLDLRTGQVTGSSAGHLPAILVGDGAPRPVFPLGGMMAGSFPGLVVKSETLVLEPGQTLVLYSDGVTEAFDPADEMFGEERLIAALADAPGGGTGETVANVLAAVRRHAAGAPQSDDITILALRRLAPGDAAVTPPTRAAGS